MFPFAPTLSHTQTTLTLSQSEVNTGLSSLSGTLTLQPVPAPSYSLALKHTQTHTTLLRPESKMEIDVRHSPITAPFEIQNLSPTPGFCYEALKKPRA